MLAHPTKSMPLDARARMPPLSSTPWSEIHLWIQLRLHAIAAPSGGAPTTLHTLEMTDSILNAAHTINRRSSPPTPSIKADLPWSRKPRCGVLLQAVQQYRRHWAVAETCVGVVVVAHTTTYGPGRWCSETGRLEPRLTKCPRRPQQTHRPKG